MVKYFNRLEKCVVPENPVVVTIDTKTLTNKYKGELLEVVS